MKKWTAFFLAMAILLLTAAGMAEGQTEDPQARVQRDGDNEDVIVYYRRNSYTLPSLKGLSGKASFSDSRTETASWREWAEEVFRAYRGGSDKTGRVICTVELDDHCGLYAFGTQGEADAILIAKLPETSSEDPLPVAYVDFNSNWETCYDGYISLGEAFDIACAACVRQWEELTPEDPLVLGGSAFVLFDAYCYDEDLPDSIEPLWFIAVVNQRADPSLEMFDPYVIYYRYPMFIDPENGEVVKIMVPETYGNG